MNKKYIAINLCAGIGTMSLAFEQAGFQVIHNYTKDTSEGSIISRNFNTDTKLLSEAALDCLPVTDIVIGSFPQIPSLPSAGRIQDTLYLVLNVFHHICCQIKPKAFIFDMNKRVLNSTIFQSIKDRFCQEGYEWYYQVYDTGSVTGAPLRQHRLYMTALRADITQIPGERPTGYQSPNTANSEKPGPCGNHRMNADIFSRLTARWDQKIFLPERSSIPHSFEEIQEESINESYIVKNETLFSSCKYDGLYVWKDGKYQLGREINGVYRLPVIKSGEMLRWVTPRELARLKGIPDDYFLIYKNKQWLYRALWAEPHYSVMLQLADKLYETLEDADTAWTPPAVIRTQSSPKNHSMKTKEEIYTVERRFDVFVSSTYEDLTEERKEVTQAILECDCMPVGMEMFPASNMEQWNFIKKVIDKSDIYLVIIAGKYGSESKDEYGNRVSYTEMEFDYALKQGKPVLAFLVNHVGKLVRNKTEDESYKMDLLMKFREKVKTGRLVKFYDNKDDLKAKVMGSLNQIKKQITSGGWIRADENNASGSGELMEKIRVLQADKETLQKLIDDLKQKEYTSELRSKTLNVELREMQKNIELLTKHTENFKRYLNEP